MTSKLSYPASVELGGPVPKPRRKDLAQENLMLRRTVEELLTQKELFLAMTIQLIKAHPDFVAPHPGVILSYERLVEPDKHDQLKVQVQKKQPGQAYTPCTITVWRAE